MENVDAGKHFDMAEENKGSLHSLINQVKLQASPVDEFTLQRKALEDHIRSSKKLLMEQAKGLAFQEQSLEDVAKQLEHWSEELEIKSKKLDECLYEVLARESEKILLGKWMEECKLEVGVKEKELELCRQGVWDCDMELAEKKRQLGLVQKELGECDVKLSANRKQQSEVQKLLEDCIKKIETKERQLWMVQKNLGEATEKLGRCTEELDGKKLQLRTVREAVGQCSKELSAKKLQLGRVQKTLEGYNREIESKERRLGLAEKILMETMKKLEGCTRELESKEKSLGSVSKLLEDSCKEISVREGKLQSLQMTVEEHSMELEKKDKDVADLTSLLKNCNCELEGKQEELQKEENLITALNSELELKGKQLETLEEALEFSSSRLKLKMEELDDVENSLDLCLKNLHSGKKELAETERIIEQNRDDFLLKEKELTGVLELIEKSSNDLASEVNRLDSIKVLIQEKSEVFQEKEKQCSALNDSINVFSLKHELAEKELCRIQGLIAESSKDLQFKMDHFESIKVQINEKTEKLKVIGDMKQPVKILSTKLKSLEAETGLIENSKTEHLATLLKSLGDPADSSSANLQFTVTTDRRMQLSVVDEGIKNEEIVLHEDLKALPVLQDPAKIVLDWLNEVGFPANEASRRVLVLEQLLEISPQIRPEVKEASVCLAVRWKTFSQETENPMEVLAFLLFVVVYGLASCFIQKEILGLVHIVAQHKQAPDICKALDLTDKMPFFLRTLTRNKKHLEAVRFSCFFGLVDEFPPEPMLKNYLKEAKREAWASKSKKNSPQVQELIIDKEIDASRALLDLMAEYKLNFGSVTEEANRRIVKLETMKASRILSEPNPVFLLEHHVQGENLHVVGSCGFRNQSPTAPRIQPQLHCPLQQHGIKRRRVDEPTEGHISSHTPSETNPFLVMSGTDKMMQLTLHPIRLFGW